jgi:antitoxin (DNA-binding transcriptional repressor) of toxin-antitoxin stability system
MAEIVNMHQAKMSLSRLVEKALAGEEVVIARNGEPRVPGRAKGRIWIAPDFDEMSEEELKDWEGC